jgi:hypothetical protein
MKNLKDLEKSTLVALVTEIENQLRNAVENSKKTAERLKPQDARERLAYEVGSLQGSIEWLIKTIDHVKK